MEPVHHFGSPHCALGFKRGTYRASILRKLAGERRKTTRSIWTCFREGSGCWAISSATSGEPLTSDRAALLGLQKVSLLLDRKPARPPPSVVAPNVRSAGLNQPSGPRKASDHALAPWGVVKG